MYPVQVKHIFSIKPVKTYKCTLYRSHKTNATQMIRKFRNAKYTQINYNLGATKLGVIKYKMSRNIVIKKYNFINIFEVELYITFYSHNEEKKCKFIRGCFNRNTVY